MQPTGWSMPDPSTKASVQISCCLWFRLALVVTSLGSCALAAAPVEVRYAEGVTHGFLQLRTADDVLIASGDLLQTARGGEVESRMVFQFKDGSLFDETVVYTQQRVFAMRSFHLVQRGPAFTEDTEIRLQGASGKYLVTTRSHDNGREETLQGVVELPADVYNGMVATVAKNLPQGSTARVHVMAFTPRPMLIELEIAPGIEHQLKVGELYKPAIHYVLKAHPGPWLEFFGRLFGRMPADSHIWIITAGGVPAFSRYEGPLDPKGPLWRIELTSPRWSE